MPPDGPVSSTLAGPEQVFVVRVTGRVANFGVVITARGPGSRVEPRVVAAGDENRLTGYASLPLNLNPYVDEFGGPTLVAGALEPRPGTYHVVFDSPSRANAGTYRFRFWTNDVRPPTASLVSGTVPAGRPFRIRVADAGAGIDPRSLEATLDGRPVRATLSGREITVSTARGLDGRPSPSRRALGLPGDAQHGERRADPPEHTGRLHQGDRPPAVTGRRRRLVGARPSRESELSCEGGR